MVLSFVHAAPSAFNLSRKIIMELQEFVEESLKQIITGISNVAEYAKEHGAEINPYQHEWNYGQGLYFDKQSGCALTPVEFDIAVTVHDEKKTKGGIGISIAQIALGSQGESAKQNERISRMKFSIPVVFPSSRILEKQ